MKTSLIAAAFVALMGSATFAHVLTQDKPMSKTTTTTMKKSTPSKMTTHTKTTHTKKMKTE